jgi:hypothetical protein
MRGEWRVLLGLVLLGLTLVAPTGLAAQSIPDRTLPQLEYQADRHEYTENPDDEEVQYLGRARPWSIAPWIPLNWQSNLALAPRAIRTGIAFEPEVTVGRTWSVGPAQLLGEVGTFVSTIPSNTSLDSSGWWLTAEANGGDSEAGVAPYASYEPLGVNDGLFGRHLVTFHTLTAGVRRSWGPTHLNSFLRRRDSTIDSLDRTLVGAQLSHSWRIRNGLNFNLRADAEYRRYDALGDDRRRDLFVRARGRLFIPLSSTTELVLTADIQRNRSSDREYVTTNVIIGPALSASFGL